MKPSITLYAMRGDANSRRLAGVLGKLKSEFGSRFAWQTVYVGKDARVRYDLVSVPSLVLHADRAIHFSGARCYHAVRTFLTSLCSQ